LYVVIVRLRERFSRRRPPAVHVVGPPTIERAPDGSIVVVFPNGDRPVRMRVPAVEETDDP
jgi:hypothetical protein